MDELRRVFARLARKSDLFYPENGINHEELTLTEKSNYVLEFAKQSEELQSLYKLSAENGYSFRDIYPAFTGIIKKGFFLNLTTKEIIALDKMKGEFALK